MILIKLTKNGKWAHCNQIYAGFEALAKQKLCSLQLFEEPASAENSSMPAHVKVEIKNKTIIFDVDDGYQNYHGIQCLLKQCDYYFKRSYKLETNQQLFPDDVQKIYPLGFNYYIYSQIADNKPLWKKIIRKLFFQKTEDYYRYTRFEAKPSHNNKPPKILFLTRLWDPDEVNNEKERAERLYINRMRIDIIKELRTRYGSHFIGGLADSSLARQLAPDIIAPRSITKKTRYLNYIKRADICIGSMGLHGSIGWKTAEYIAAAKAIVSEQFAYTVPGPFEEGKNYIAYNNVAECLNAIDTLYRDNIKMDEMKAANYTYYHQHLKPDVLILNALRTAQVI